MTSTARTDLEARLSPLIRDVPDFPEPGIVFKDIAPLLADHEALSLVVDALADAGRNSAGEPTVDKVVGIESRGFILAAPVALQLGTGFVPVRKKGKLPGPTYSQSYALEYGEATLEVHEDAFIAGQRVLVVDDVLATGGTAGAAIELVERAGGTVAGFTVLMELGFLDGRERLAPRTVHALLTV